MIKVESPYMRREVIDAVASIADPVYQHRVWILHELPIDHYYDELDLNIHILFDDTEVLPNPDVRRSGVLLPGAEVRRLRALGELFDPMIDRLGDATDEVYVADPLWKEVVGRAAECLPALILAGGWEYTETDADADDKHRAEGRIPTVDLPATRRRVIRAVAALADDEYQQRTWASTNDDSVTGSPIACLRTLTDDGAVLPHPSTAIGRVLLAGDEIDRLATLEDTLWPYRDKPVAEPWRDPAWQPVIDAARNCLPAMVIAGAWVGPDPEGPDAERTAPPV